jgi:hypothetical protein
MSPAKILSEKIIGLRAVGAITSFAPSVKVVATFSTDLEFTLGGVVVAEIVAIKDDRPSYALTHSDGSVTLIPGTYLMLQFSAEAE